MSQNENCTPGDFPIILLVEDEPLIRLVASDVLSDAGFRVIEACNADEAMTFVEAKPEAIAVVTDVKMPGSLDGFALAHLVASRWPHMGIVVTSGHALAGEGDLPPGSIFLSKPYQPSSLIAAVRKVTQDVPLTVIPLPPAGG